MEKTLRIFLACVVASISISSLDASQRKRATPQITGIYSNLRYVRRAGDVVGMEIFIVGSVDSYYANVQIAEGAPEPPVVVKVDIKGSSIEFTLPDTSGVNRGRFTGRISAGGITGKFQNAEKAEVLSRGKSYWQ
jgi:hypothetical protein